MSMKTFFMGLLLLTVVSCSSTDGHHEESSRDDDFVTGASYELKKPAYIWAGKLVLLKAKEPADSQGVVKPGNRHHSPKDRNFREPMTGNVTDVFGEVLSGN